MAPIGVVTLNGKPASVYQGPEIVPTFAFADSALREIEQHIASGHTTGETAGVEWSYIQHEGK